MARALNMVHKEDPKKVILDYYSGMIDKMQVLGPLTLVGVYKRPKTFMLGGREMEVPDRMRDEDDWQGKVGLVLKLGPMAFQDDDSHRFGGVVPSVGDWVLFNTGDTFGTEVGERRCRFVEDVHNEKTI